jgi:hypothetical protein
LSGDYNYGAPSDWGPTSINTITGDLEWISDNVDSLGCNPATNNLTGKVAIVRRGACMFSLKAYHAQAQGAIGCVICNNIPGGGLVGMLGGDSMSAVTIPAVFLTYEDCELLHQQVDAGNTTNASFYVPSVYDARTSFAHNTPLQHIQPLSGIAITLYNTSSAPVNNISVTATITDPLGADTTFSETLTTIAGTYDTTVVFTQSYTPSAVGTYDIVYKTGLNTADSVTHQFEINNDSTFALDNNNFTPSSVLGGVGPNDADYALADPVTGATYFYEMGATYLTGSGTSDYATSASFALENANAYIGKNFYFFLYEQPASGFVGTEQDYSTFIALGAGIYTVTPADTMTQHSLMNAPLYTNAGALSIPLSADKQYMLVVRHAGDASVLASPKISYTHIEDFLSVAATCYVDRLYMAGWNPSYAPVIRMHVQAGPVTGVENKSLALSEVAVFPNPTNDYINLQIRLNDVSDQVNVKIFDVNGQVHQSNQYNNIKNAVYNYNVEHLAAGIYFMHVQTDKAQTIRKVIIK